MFDFLINVGLDMIKVVIENDWLLEVEWGLIGFCINFFYEDLIRVVFIV